MDSATFKENTENDIYTILWRRSVSGLYIGPGGRQYVDRYIRPGQLELEFKRLGKSLDLPRKVRLQEIIIASQVGEELSGARQRAMLVRSRARRGEDFEALNVEFGVPTREVDGVPTYGVDLDPIEEAKLPARSDIFAFVQSAQPGDVSEPLPAANASGVIGGFRLLRLVERIEGAAKSFQEREFQGQLRDAQVERRENFLVERGLARLMSAAYIWPPEVSPRSELPPPPGAQGDPAQPGQPEVQPESAEAPVPAGEVPAEAQAEDPAEAPVEAPVEEPAEKPAEGAPQAPEQPPANGGTGGGR